MKQTSNWQYTKIVSTIGPATDSVETLKKLIKAGMNVARLNTKHGTSEWHAERVDRIRQAASELKKPIGILLDLQGPEIRINLKDHKSFEVKANGLIKVVSSFGKEDDVIQIPANVIDSLSVGNLISVDDGTCELEVVKKEKNTLQLKALTAFVCKDRKTLNTPGVVIDLPSLIEADYDKLDMAKDHPVDFIALSFVRDAKDIQILRNEMKKRKIEAEVVAKIENQASIDNLDEIIDASDAVMVARGDLAVEVPLVELSYHQKEIIRRSRNAGKPVITATQMLKSMIDNPRPTRAEVSDVSNAVFDGTDAVMLSEETAMGKYPVETVTIMRKIVQFNEPKAITFPTIKNSQNRTTAVTKMAMSLLTDKIETIDKVIVFTETGFTAEQLVRHRPYVPVIAVTDRESTVQKCSLMYSVSAYKHSFPEGKIENIHVVINEFRKNGMLSKSDRVLVIHGTVYKKPGFTNTVTVIEKE